MSTQPVSPLGRLVESAVGLIAFAGEDSTVPGMAAFVAIPHVVRGAARLGYDSGRDDHDD